MTLRFARKSTHVNKAENGTATWKEFDGGLRVQHSEHEREYTPDVFDSFKVSDWDREIDALGDELGEYKDVKMSSMSLRHQCPFDPTSVSLNCFHILYSPTISTKTHYNTRLSLRNVPQTPLSPPSARLPSPDRNRLYRHKWLHRRANPHKSEGAAGVVLQ